MPKIQRENILKRPVYETRLTLSQLVDQQIKQTGPRTLNLVIVGGHCNIHIVSTYGQNSTLNYYPRKYTQNATNLYRHLTVYRI